MLRVELLGWAARLVQHGVCADDSCSGEVSSSGSDRGGEHGDGRLSSAHSGGSGTDSGDDERHCSTAQCSTSSALGGTSSLSHRPLLPPGCTCLPLELCVWVNACRSDPVRVLLVDSPALARDISLLSQSTSEASREAMLLELGLVLERWSAPTGERPGGGQGASGVLGAWLPATSARLLAHALRALGSRSSVLVGRLRDVLGDLLPGQVGADAQEGLSTLQRTCTYTCVLGTLGSPKLWLDQDS